MSYEVVPKARCVRAVAVFVLLGALVAPVAAEADPPAPLNVLFVANGWCSQEDDIENHFLDLGYNVTRIKDYKVKSTTNFATYDLVVLIESAPLVSTAGLNAIKASGKPVLVVESWTFLYAYRLGLTTSPLARISYGETVDSLIDGYTDLTSRVGAEAVVYDSEALVFGVNPAHLKSSVTPLYESTGCMSGVAVFADYERKTAVAGVSETSEFTVNGWKMLDKLVQQILPAPPEYPTMQAVARAYVESGFPGLLTRIEADLRREPGSWTFEQAEEEAWLVATEWRLDELWDYMRSSLSIVFYDAEVPPGDSVVPLPETPGHPHRPTAVCANCFPEDPLYNGAEAEHWFLGQYWNSVNNPDDPPEWSEYHGGTDLGLGMNVAINGKRYYYMGDTWDAASGPMWSRNDCDVSANVRCDDMIVVSTDGYPENGIDVSPILELQKLFFTTRWRSIVIPGVHQDISPYLQSPSGALFWTGDIPEPRYTVPTGVVAARLPLVTDLPVPSGTVFPPMVVLWYGTAINPNPGQDDLEELTFSDADPTRSPKSWVGCSFDGIHFRACYTDSLGYAVPFSEDTAPYSNYPTISDPGGESEYPGAPARFVQVAAVDVTASDLEALCSVDPD